MKVFVVVCAVFFSFLNGCKSDEQESASPSDEQESASPNVLNIIVILDTSDRTRHSDQIERDIEIAEEIVVNFVDVAQKHIGQSKLSYEGSLTVVVPDQPSVPSIERQIMGKLTIKGSEWDSIKEMEDYFTQQKEVLLEGMSQLYEVVVQHPQTGSDIWGWFKYEAGYHFDENQRNLIICLSDGYLNFDKNIEARRREGTFMKIGELRDDPNCIQKIRNSEGLKPIGKDFSPYNVRFLMLEIAPQSDSAGIPYQQDFDIIEAYWDTWLNSMGIKDTDFLKRGSGIPDRKIESFISSESR